MPVCAPFALLTTYKKRASKPRGGRKPSQRPPSFSATFYPFLLQGAREEHRGDVHLVAHHTVIEQELHIVFHALQVAFIEAADEDCPVEELFGVGEADAKNGTKRTKSA